MRNPEFPKTPDAKEQSLDEDLQPHHFYAAYIYEDAEAHESDITTLLESAQELGYPRRYWWLSEVIDIKDSPDRLIVCIHHPSSTEDAGMDLYDKLKTQQVVWDELEAATVEEYRQFGKPVSDLGKLYYPDGALLFPPGEPTTIEWQSGQEKLALRFQWDSPTLTTLLPIEQRKIRQALGKVALLIMAVLEQKEAFKQAGAELDYIFSTLADLVVDITTIYQLTPEQQAKLFNTAIVPQWPTESDLGPINKLVTTRESPGEQTPTDDKARFTAWFDQVDKAVEEIAGCSVHDLPDIDFWSLFDGDALPVEAAIEVLREAGYPDLA